MPLSPHTPLMIAVDILRARSTTPCAFRHIFVDAIRRWRYSDIDVCCARQRCAVSRCRYVASLPATAYVSVCLPCLMICLATPRYFMIGR